MLLVLLDVDFRSMKRTPNAPDVLVDAGNRLAGHPLVLLRTGVSQELDFLSHCLGGQVLDIYRFLVTVEVVCGDDGVLVVFPVHLKLDLGISLREHSELIFEVRIHATGGAGPVAVSECDALARKDKGANAILRRSAEDGSRYEHDWNPSGIA